MGDPALKIRRTSLASLRRALTEGGCVGELVFVRCAECGERTSVVYELAAVVDHQFCSPRCAHAFVGRERELATIDHFLAHCEEHASSLPCGLHGRALLRWLRDELRKEAHRV